MTTTPSVSTVSDTTLNDTQTSIVITGSNFGALDGSVSIGGQAQTVTSWGTASITFTAVQGSLNSSQAYDLTVTDISANVSAGYSVSFNAQEAQQGIMVGRSYGDGQSYGDGRVYSS